MKENNSKKEVKKLSLFNEVIGEYKKIIWPSRKDKLKQTKIVITVSALIGAFIVSFDFVFGFLMDTLAQFL